METTCICKFCGRTCKNPNSHRNHERLCPKNPDRHYVSHTLGKSGSHSAWNKGKTKETDPRISKIAETYKANLRNGKFLPPQLGKHLSAEHRKSISNFIKLAHSENRAHNIGQSRWNNDHSYPEKWFIKVLRKEFRMEENIDYNTEYPFGRYSLDFAWPSKKLCIEIDGRQHLRFEEYRKRDLEKDKILNENSWKVIRIPWEDCYHRPKYYIEYIRSVFESLNLF
jgi:very-short-patch-repair endonuclease